MIMFEEAWHYVVVGILAVLGIIGFWFLTWYLIAPAVITAFNLDMDNLTVTLIIFFGGDTGILGLAIWGKRR